MKIKWLHGTCGSGHPMKNPFTRTLEISWADKVLEIRIRIRPRNPFRMPMCGKCLGVR